MGTSMPKYRIRIEVYDENVGEIVSETDQPLMSVLEDNAGYLHRVLRSFAGDKESHQITHYPDGIQEETIQF